MRYMLGNLNSLLRLAPQSLVAQEVLPGSLDLFARMKSLLPPCRPCHRPHQLLPPNIRQELKKDVSPLLDALIHSLLTTDLMQPASRQVLIQRLCCLESGPKSEQLHQPHAVASADLSANGRAEAELCDDAAGRLVLVQSVLHNIGTHSEDVQQEFVRRLPDLFRLLQTASPHCLTLPRTGGIPVGPQGEEEADLLFRSSVMFGALLSVVPGKLRYEAQSFIVAQVLSYSCLS